MVAPPPLGSLPAIAGTALLLEPGAARALGRRGGYALGHARVAPQPHSIRRPGCSSATLLFIPILLATHPTRTRLGSPGAPYFGAFCALGHGGAGPPLGNSIRGAHAPHPAGLMDAFALPAGLMDAFALPAALRAH